MPCALTQNLPANDAYLRSTALDGYDLAILRRALAAAEQAGTLDSVDATVSGRGAGGAAR